MESRNATRRKQTQSAALMHARQGAERTAELLRAIVLKTQLEAQAQTPAVPAGVDALYAWSDGNEEPQIAMTFGKFSQRVDDGLAMQSVLARTQDPRLNSFWVDSKLILVSRDASTRTYVVIDPRRAALLPSSGNALIRSALLNPEGIFQLHTVKGMVGSRAASLSSAPSKIRTLEGWEAYETTQGVKGFPLQFRAEVIYRPLSASILMTKDFIVAFLLASGALLLLHWQFVFAALFSKRGTQPQGEALLRNPPRNPPRAPLQAELKSQPEPELPVVAAPPPVSDAMQALVSAVAGRRKSREELLFDRLALALRPDVGARATALRVISDYTASPILFFEFDALHSVARLVAESGMDADLSILTRQPLAFPIAGESLLRLHGMSVEDQGMYFCEYAPLARILLAKLGVAHYEAWPVHKDLPLNGGGQRLLGVLIVLQPGVDSFLNREGLLEMLTLLGKSYAELSHEKIAIEGPSLHP